MTRERLQKGLAWVVGIVFIVFGIIEVGVRVVSPDPIEVDALAFWFVSLCGGGALVLVGSFLVTRPVWASFALVAVGCLAGSVATMWTLLLPVLALTVLVLAVPRGGEQIA